MTFYTLEPMQAKILEMGGELVSQRKWREGGDEIEERDFQIGTRGVRLQQDIRDGLSVEVKANINDSSAWRPLLLFVHPEIENMTTEQQFQWINTHPVPDAQTYFSWLVEQIENFAGQS